MLVIILKVTISALRRTPLHLIVLLMFFLTNPHYEIMQRRGARPSGSPIADHGTLPNPV